MFKFNFGEKTSSEGEENKAQEKILTWNPVKVIDTSKLEYDNLDFDNDFAEKEVFPNVKIKLINTNAVIEKLKQDNYETVVEAESQHSDLIPAKYEGGLKIWECTYDLGNYILNQNYNFDGKLVLDLGCGMGLIGLLALMKGATVHFQDYNEEIIKYVTIPNVEVNNASLDGCKFYSGDWESFTETLNEQSCSEMDKYDFIFTSETIYNPDNYEKLLNVFRCRLKNEGIGLIAAKTYYFGVGGGMRQFEELVKKKNFKSEIVWSSETGLQREIMKISRQPSN